MSDKSKIEWTDATWNPVTGCSKVSEGCRNCYALTFAERFRGTPGHYFERGFDVTLRPDKLDQPLRWRRPRRIFVNSMSDLFHPEVSDDFIDQVFAVMALAPQHTFQMLTKRPERMAEYFRHHYRHAKVEIEAAAISIDAGVEEEEEVTFDWPLPNVWLGVSVENQKAADERIPLLLQTPAAVRFLSCEPLLGPVDLDRWVVSDAMGVPIGHEIDWVIVGGESGPGARPVHPDWVRSLRDQCQAAGVPFFFKQQGEWCWSNTGSDRIGFVAPDGKWGASQPFGWGADYPGSVSIWRVGKKAAGRLLDGRTWDEFPSLLGDNGGDWG
jgi:protein gp37